MEIQQTFIITSLYWRRVSRDERHHRLWINLRPPRRFSELLWTRLRSLELFTAYVINYSLQLMAKSKWRMQPSLKIALQISSSVILLNGNNLTLLAKSLDNHENIGINITSLAALCTDGPRFAIKWFETLLKVSRRSKERCDVTIVKHIIQESRVCSGQFSSNMKMEGVGDIMNGRTNEVAKTPQPSPKVVYWNHTTIAGLNAGMTAVNVSSCLEKVCDIYRYSIPIIPLISSYDLNNLIFVMLHCYLEIGREFVRQYYTMLSERPQDVFRFYSHESYFAHDTDQPVQGQQKIQKAIERLAFVDCKARIYTVSGTATMNNGLVIQVCGELSTGDNPGRRFLQTFILCPQTPKKYYVHNDVFQWLDRAFGDTIIQPQKNDVQTQIVTEENVGANGGAGGINGHTQTLSASHNQQHLEPLPSMNANAIVRDAKHQINDLASSKSDDSSTEEAQTEDSSSVTIDPTPKTWAKLVGGNQTAAANIAAQLQNMNQATTQPPARLPIMQNQTSMSIANNANLHANFEDNCRLYVGGITRNIIPESAAAIERDIRSEFEKFGHVAAVNVPRRVLDSTDPQRTVFAFVVMRTPEGARNAFNAARKERSLSLIHLKIDSLGFDGEATLSEQKGGQMNSRTSFMHRGPPLQGLSRGGFSVRNGSSGGRGGGGGARGLRHYSGGSEYRQSSEHGRH
ncbi:Ras GTPase-activating protein-binding protein 2 [Dirofilaria immitis]|nr:Ras GTPase-activating protein-binding protein 2 [Dirofilaria immitis]